MPAVYPAARNGQTLFLGANVHDGTNLAKKQENKSFLQFFLAVFSAFLSIRRVSIRSANKKGKDLVAFPF